MTRTHWIFKSHTWLLLVSILFFLTINMLLHFIVLPLFLPSLHGGNGMLKGGDWLWFFQLSIERYQDLKINGINVWEMRPQGQFPVGVASLVFWIFDSSSRVPLLILQSILFATGCVIAAQITAKVLNQRISLIHLVIYLIMPTSLLIYTPLHKDVFTFLGTMIVINSLIVTKAENSIGPADVLKSLLFLILGLVIVWLPRPYHAQLFGLAIIVSLPFFAYNMLKSETNIKSVISWFLLASSIAIFAIIQSTSLSESKPADIIKPIENMSQRANTLISQKTENVPSSWVFPETLCPLNSDLIQSKVIAIDLVRKNFIAGYPRAMSNIGIDESYENICALIVHIPKAFVRSLFAPYPDMWLGQANSPGGSAMRLLNGFEMIIFYGLTIATVINLYRASEEQKFSNSALAGVLVFCCLVMIIMLLAIPNMGTIVRMRYGFWMLIANIMLAYNYKHWRQSLEWLKNTIFGREW